jgi:F0F1-type ATP synthase membrane subunit c/vacuolar-type H+-ATPase subunit K
MNMPRQIRLFRLIVGAFFASIFCCFTTQPVLAQSAVSFQFDTFNTGTAKMAGIPFQVTITALDSNGDQAIGYSGNATLVDETGTIYPTQTANFINGVWSGMVYITQSTTENIITASNSSVVGASQTFTVSPDTRMSFLSVISGNNQGSITGAQLAYPFVAQVNDLYGNPIPNIGVNFTVANFPPGATGYNLTNNSATSDANGRISTVLRLGTKAGAYLTTATITNGLLRSVTFFANATPGPLISLSIRPYIAVIPAGTSLPLEAVGYDQYFNEISKPPVAWSVQNGGGTIDSTGVFRAGMILGSFTNTIKATSASVGANASVSVVDVYQGETDYSGPGAGQGTGIAATVSATPVPVSGVLYNVQVEPDVLSILQNARIPIIAEGVDFFGNPVSGVSYQFQTTGDIGTLVQTGANTALLTGSGTGIGTVTVTATQGGVERTARVIGSIGVGMNRRLVIEDIQSPQTVGEPFTISIAAKDSLNNFITDYAGPLVIADTTGTIDPAVVQPSDQGIWYVQAIISVSHPEVSITVAGDGMVGVSNVFEVVGDPKKSDLGLGGGGGLGDVLGASISAKISEIMAAEGFNKYVVVKYIGAGLAAGLGILGASAGGGIMASRGMEAIGRNPYAKSRLQANLYIGLIVFIAVASLAVFASTIIMR